MTTINKSIRRATIALNLPKKIPDLVLYANNIVQKLTGNPASRALVPTGHAPHRAREQSAHPADPPGDRRGAPLAERRHRSREHPSRAHGGALRVRSVQVGLHHAPAQFIDCVRQRHVASDLGKLGVNLAKPLPGFLDR